MKTILTVVALALLPLALHAQFTSGGTQEGGHGSGGDEKAEYTIVVNPSWNMVSVPITLGDYAKTSVFPSAASSAFAYQGGYVVEDTLDNGAGYWVKFPAAQALSLSGALIDVDSLAVAPGWNIVGSISSPVPASSVTAVGTSIQTGFFAFDNGYQAASTIEPGRGYWVKVSSAGTLVLLSGGTPAPQRESAEEYLASLNSLSITDASGGERRLYFAPGNGELQARFELPPVPPSGIFDARFASQNMVAQEEAAIMLSSAAYPLEVRWNVLAPGDYALVVDGKETALNSNGSLRISRLPSHLVLRIGAGADLPTEFALSQNYPNPFNPVTRIEYAVPAGTHPAVSLQVYDVLGRLVSTLVNEVKEPGTYAVRWDAGSVASGVYYYRLDAGNFQAIRKMLLLK